MTKEEAEQKKDKYLKTLAENLIAERNAKGFTQQELSEGTHITREKINYAELNIKGRKLQIEELALIAETLNISTDYLLGITTNSNTNTNDTVKQDLEDQELLDNVKVYSILSYINRNILTSAIKSIESKVMENVILSNADKQKLGFLLSYIDAFRLQRVKYSNYVKTLLEEYKEEFLKARKECEQLILYNDYEDIKKINFGEFESLREILEEFERYVRLELKEQQARIIDNMPNEISKDDKYYYKAIKMLKEISKQE